MMTDDPHVGPRAGAALAILLALVAASCSKSPTTPTPGRPRVNAPVASSPANGVEVDTLRPELVADNATSTTAGERTYEFQVSSTPDFSGVSPAVLIAKTGVAEGPGGKTSFTLEEDLKIATAYFWRARAAQSGVSSAWSAVAAFRTRTKAPPVVRVSLPGTRIDAEETMTLTAAVESADTPASQLIYEWASDTGTFTGTGQIVTWRAPRGAEPGEIELKVTVTDKYTVSNADGSTTEAENKVTASAKVTYNDSFAEVRDLALGFIGDFSNSNNSAAYCVRNFSDSCGGKSAELSDIEANRARVTILSADYGLRDIIFNADKTVADVVARCNWVSRVKTTGRTETTTGTCLIQAIYEKSNWWLCDSRHDGSTTVTWGSDER